MLPPPLLLYSIVALRPFQVRVNSHRLLLIGGSGVGCVDPNLDLGPPLMELLGRAVIGFRGCNNFLQRKGACSSGHDICLMHEELGKCNSEVLLVLDELLNSCFPIHCCLVGGGVGSGLLETREPKSVMVGIQQRGQWYIIWNCRDSRYLEV